MRSMQIMIVAAVLFPSIFLPAFVSGHDLSFDEKGQEYSDERDNPSMETVTCFIENRGQLNRDDILFYTTGSGRIGLGADKVVFVMTDPNKGSLSYEIRFEDCNSAVPEGCGPSRGVYNYLVGSRENWRINIPTYTGVYYTDLWDGIDLRYHSNQGRMKYDFILNPGSDPGDIRMEYLGIQNLKIKGNGDLVVETSAGSVIDHGLIAVQDGMEIPVEFSIYGGNRISFDAGYYDSDRTLVIDPYLQFSTYFPESRNDVTMVGTGSNEDDIYIAGTADSPDFPTTPGVFDTTAVKYEGFVSRMKSDLSDFIFSTVLGGSGIDKVEDIVVDEDGNIYIGGLTDSLDFPTTSGALNETSNIWTDPHTPDPYDDETHHDAFLTKMNPDGTDLIYSTYLGGHYGEKVRHVDIDSSGNLYASGYVRSTDFPLVNPYQDELLGNQDYFILKLNPQGSELVYSTYFGFNETWGWEQDYDEINSIAVDEIGRVVFCGTTDDEDFPVTSGAYESKHIEDMGYLAMLYPDGSDLEFCTYICEGMVPQCMVLDSFSDIHIAGMMISDTLDLTSNAIDTTFSSQLEGFVSTMDFNGTTLKYSTYFGGNDIDLVHDIDIGPSENIWIAGMTDSSDLAVTDDAYQNSTAGEDEAFAACISSGGDNLLFSTYFGGSDNDDAEDIVVLNMNEFYICGRTYSLDLPVTTGVLQENFTGQSFSTFISKIKINSDIPSAPTNPFIVEGDDYLNISWITPLFSGNEDLVNYTIYRSLSDSQFEPIAIVDAGINWFNDTGLEKGLRHYYRISANNIVGEGPMSSSISGIPSSTPGKPVVSKDEIGDSFINVSWTDPADDGGRDITGFMAYIGPSPGDLSPFDAYENHWFNFTKLENGRTYYVGASATNLLGEGAISDLISAIPMSKPSMPENLKAVPGEGFVQLFWDRPADDGGDPDLRYAVYDSGDNITFDLLQEGIEETQFNVTPFPSGDFRLFHVRAGNLMGYGAPSDVAFSKSVARPSAPREFTVVMGDSCAYLRWQLPESLGGFDTVSYTVFVGNEPHEMEDRGTDISGVSYDIRGLTNGATYYFAVCAVNPGGEGEWTEVIKGMPIGTPSKPLNLTAEPVDSGMILRWDPPLDLGGSSHLSYVIYSGTNPENQAEINTTASTKYTITGLQNGLSYYFRVRGRSGSMEGDLSDMASGVPMGLPGSPINVEVMPGDGSLLISWDEPPENGGSPTLTYRVLITLISDGSTISYDDLSDNSFEIKGLINGEEYSVVLLAENSMGASIPSDLVNAVPRGVPGPLASFSVVQIGKIVELRWSAPGSDGGSDITGYRIYRGTSQDEMRLLADLEADVDSYIDENTLKGVTYHYKLVAYNDVGESEDSSIISIETSDEGGSEGDGMLRVSLVMGSIIIILLILLIFVLYTRKMEKESASDGPLAGYPYDANGYPPGMSSGSADPTGTDGSEE